MLLEAIVVGTSLRNTGLSDAPANSDDTTHLLRPRAALDDRRPTGTRHKATFQRFRTAREAAREVAGREVFLSISISG